MTKPVCVPCKRFFRPEKNGYSLVEGMPIVNLAPPGNAAPEQWAPYKLWRADKWKCQGCGHEIVVGFGSSPIAEHYEPDFEKTCELMGAELQVNDC
jgi:hypothetical protein